MGLMAGYGVQLWPILQDVHQLRATYGAARRHLPVERRRPAGVRRQRSRQRPLVSDLLGQETVVFQTMSRALDSEETGISYGEQHTARPAADPR
jgi:type IV secretion system protein VirD4